MTIVEVFVFNSSKNLVLIYYCLIALQYFTSCLTLNNVYLYLLMSYYQRIPLYLMHVQLLSRHTRFLLVIHACVGHSTRHRLWWSKHTWLSLAAPCYWRPDLICGASMGSYFVTAIEADLLEVALSGGLMFGGSMMNETLDSCRHESVSYFRRIYENIGV